MLTQTQTPPVPRSSLYLSFDSLSSSNLQVHVQDGGLAEIGADNERLKMVGVVEEQDVEKKIGVYSI